MGRPGRGQHWALSQSASADTSRARSREYTVSRYRASNENDLTRGELYKNSEPATARIAAALLQARNGVSKLNRADCFCDTEEESNKKAKSVFRIRPRSELQQNTMYVSPHGPAPGYRGPLHPYQGFRPVQTPAPASWSGYQVSVSSCLTSCVVIFRVKPTSCPPPPLYFIV